MYLCVDSWSTIHAMHFQNNQKDALCCITCCAPKRSIVCMNWGSTSKPTNKMSFLHIWKKSMQRHHRKSRDLEGRSLRDACLWKPRSLHSQWLMKSQLVEQVPARKIKTDNYWTLTTNWRFFFVKMVMEWSMSFSDCFLKVSFTSCGNYSTEMHTHSLVARTFFCAQRTHCVLRTSSCVCTYTHGSSFCKKGVCTCVIPLYLAFSLFTSHPSLLFLHGHFETTPDYDLTDSDIHKFLPYFPVLKAQDMRHSAPASRSLAARPNQMQTQRTKIAGWAEERTKLQEARREKESTRYWPMTKITYFKVIADACLKL